MTWETGSDGRSASASAGTRAILRVFVKGGVISPADLLRTMDASVRAGNDFIMFSSRQEILFPASSAEVAEAEAVLRDADIEFVRTDVSRITARSQPRNIVSSYAAVNVLDTTWWLKEDVYHYVLANFHGPPRLKVNIVDPVQSLVPLFGGHLHFVASKKEHYWQLYLRADDLSERIERWPGLLHGDDLARVTGRIEAKLLADPVAPLSALVEDVHEHAAFDDSGPREELRLPSPFFPYYEGLNPMLNNHFWLGLYWRNNRFDIEFLRAACLLCQETKVGKISLTPWKSFIIKGIRAEDRVRWEKLMGVFGINMRHSSLELNWHIPVLDDESLALKNGLVRELTLEDISTHGLTITVKSPEPTPLFTSVVIEREAVMADGPPRYTIRHAKDFDPNRSEYRTFAEGLTRSALPDELIELTRRYSSGIGSFETGHVEARDEGAAETPRRQCEDCLTVYDPAYGDPVSGVPAGVSFEGLPRDYRCPVCSADKERFAPMSA